MLSLPGNGVFLSSLLKKERITAPEEIFVCSCSTNPEDFLHKGLFVCLARPEEKIISEVSMAVEHGAEVVIVRSGCQASVQENFPDALVLEAADPRVIYGKICQEFYGNPAGKLKLIAVTGTSGKTSLSYVIAGILAEAGYPVGLIGTLGVYDGQTLTPCSETTPDPERMAELLAKMVENECTHAIIEVSSVAIEKRWLSGLLFDAVCLTNIRRDHLDYHRTVDQYRRTKMQIFKYLKKDAIAICNLDDRVSDAVLHLIDCPTMTVGMYPTECMVSGMLVEQSISNQVFYIFAGTDAVPVHTHIIGNEHIYNCLLATALGISWDIDLKTVVRGIERVEHIPGRFEQIDCGQPFGVFVDNANTSESLMAVLKTIRSVTPGKVYCVVSAPNDNDRSKRPLMGRTAESLCDVTVVTQNSQAADEMKSGIKGREEDNAMSDLIHGVEFPENIVKCQNRREAIVWALSNADADDTVLIISSDNAIQNTGNNRIADRQFVRQWLYENQPCVDTFWD